MLTEHVCLEVINVWFNINEARFAGLLRLCHRLVGLPKLVILFRASLGAILQSADCMQLLASHIAAVSEWQKLHAPKGPVRTFTQTKTVLSIQQTVPSGN